MCGNTPVVGKLDQRSFSMSYYLSGNYIYIFKKILAPLCHGRGFEHRPAKAFANPDDFQGHKIFQCRYTVKSLCLRLSQEVHQAGA